MRASSMFLIALPLSLPHFASGATYTLTKTWAGNDFLSSDWVWYTGNDPSNGRVNYVTKTVAEQESLVQTSGSVLFFRSDHFRTLNSVVRGRDSIRISSQESWDDAVFVLDLEHMPTGCATWPAFWTISATGPWPAGGEIDIIEGVNLNTHNQATLHTTSGCKMPPDGLRSQAGITLNTDCAAGDVGCGVKFTDPGSFGSGFNGGNGGIYVMSKSQSTGIQIWFWPSHSTTIPPELRSGSTLTPNSRWGIPAANFTFVPGFCDYSRHFNAHKIVIDLTFCGDWAGNVWAKSNCAARDSSCTDYVNNNPEEFVDAFWAINSLRVYT